MIGDYLLISVKGSGATKMKDRIKETGEVFTPPELVKDMLDELPPETWTDSTKTFLEPSCGDGNFLIALKERLMAHGHDERQVLERLHGVELMQDNVDECKDRLDSFNQYRDILDKNIVCADGLRYHYRFDGSYRYDNETAEIADKKHFDNFFEIA